jgi:hypothetical protein
MRTVLSLSLETEFDGVAPRRAAPVMLLERSIAAANPDEAACA